MLAGETTELHSLPYRLLGCISHTKRPHTITVTYYLYPIVKRSFHSSLFLSMSTFVSVFVKEIAGRTQLPAADQQQRQSFVSGADSERKQKLQNALLELNPPATEQSILAALTLLCDAAALSGDPEEESLKQAVLGRVILSVYADALNAYLDQATEAESEAEWWDNVERSRYELAWYLLQSK